MGTLGQPREEARMGAPLQVVTAANQVGVGGGGGGVPSQASSRQHGWDRRRRKSAPTNNPHPAELAAGWRRFSDSGGSPDAWLRRACCPWPLRSPLPRVDPPPALRQRQHASTPLPSQAGAPHPANRTTREGAGKAGGAPLYVPLLPVLTHMVPAEGVNSWRREK